MKRIVCYIFILLFLASAAGAQVASTVTPSPSAFRVPRGMPSTITINYALTDVECSSAASGGGQFLKGSTVLGTVGTSLSATLSGPVGAPSVTGSVSESLPIPRSVLIAAERAGLNSFSFKRTFNFIGPAPCNPGTVTATVSIRVVSKTTAELRITRLQLYFDNKRPEITIKKNQPSPTAYARITFSGSGFLDGRWEIDGRILSHVRRHLYYGKYIEIQTPQIPGLPTFEDGTHRVRFVVTRPSGNYEIPFALFEVVPEEYEASLRIAILAPGKGRDVKPGGAEFTWKGAPAIDTYLLQFYEEGGITPIFSAYTRDAHYSIPQLIMDKMFLPGQFYLWQIKGFDRDSSLIGESETGRFIFRNN